MKIILATHGSFADGILSSAKLILGDEMCSDIVTLCAYTTDDYDLRLEVEKKLNELKYESLVVMTDMFGGSVNNEFFNFQEKYKFELITGLNLPLLLEVIINKEQLNLDYIIDSSKYSIKRCKQTLDKIEIDDF